jgi:thiol peroxidase
MPTTVTLRGTPTQVIGELPKQGTVAPVFRLVSKDLKDTFLHDFAGKRKVLNIFPSVDTATCAISVQKFNQRAADLPNTVVLCISSDLPFAQARFCGANNISNVVMLSMMRGRNFSKDYGVLIGDGPLMGLSARAVIVLDETNTVLYSELVPELSNQPNYDAAIQALSR